MCGFFGIGARAVLACLLSLNLFLMITRDLYAANPYGLGEVDYFHNKAKSKILKNDSFDWTETSLTTEGKVTNYTPPTPMLTLLENPTVDNAQAYLDWQKLRVKKIIKAQEIIDQVLKEGK